jgi:AbrB family looped-hinge helix DNA binding protein
MGTVTVSPKYQVVIPKEARERFDIKPGEQLQVLTFHNRIVLVRTRSMKEARGMFKGMDPTFVRDEDDRI